MLCTRLGVLYFVVKIKSVKERVTPSGAVRVAFFDTKSYDREAFEALNKDKYNFKIKWFKEKLCKPTSSMAYGCQVVCCFVNDTLDEEVIKRIADGDTALIAMRCAGKNGHRFSFCQRINLE